MRACCVIFVTLSAAFAMLAAQWHVPASAEKSRPTLTQLIDTEIEKVWQRDEVKPASPATDEEFVRRVYLDVVGIPPTAPEALAFIDDDNPGKRADLIDGLLDDPRFGQHMADLWTPILRERGNDFGELSLAATDVFAVWLAEQFNADEGFDKTVTAIVTAEGPISENPAAAYYALMGVPARSPNMGGLTTKHFAGIQIQCAECHDHPYEPAWTEGAFKGMASFFTGIEVNADFTKQPIDPRVETRPIPPRALIEAYARSPDLPPEALQRVEDLLAYDRPQLLGDRPVKTRDTKLWRKLFASWLTNRKNETARRYLANRFWSFLFGAGLMNPVDDFNSLSEASHPELLATLGDWFAGQGYSVKGLYRAILNSRVYQLSGRGGEGGEYWHFNRAPVRQLTPEQFFGALFNLRDGDAMLKPFARKTLNTYERLRQFKTFSDMQGGDYEAALDEDLLKTYEGWVARMGTEWKLRRGLASQYVALASDDERVQSDTFSLSIDQALSILNGDVTRRLSDSRNGSLVYAVMRDHKEDAARVVALYLSILSRRPDEKEATRAREYLKDAKGPDQLKYEDLFYALIATTEFATNH
jgi:hypothetical protein